jgi:hypothetical protein
MFDASLGREIRGDGIPLQIDEEDDRLEALVKDGVKLGADNLLTSVCRSLSVDSLG